MQFEVLHQDRAARELSDHDEDRTEVYGQSRARPTTTLAGVHISSGALALEHFYQLQMYVSIPKRKLNARYSNGTLRYA